MLSTAVVNEDIHWIPGRLRLNIPGLRKNQICANNLVQGLSFLEGIQDVRPNIITGKILITYNPSILNINQLFTVINETISRENSRDFSSQTVRTVSQKKIPVIEPEDTALQQQWMHVIGGGSLLAYLLIKKLLFSSSSLARNPGLSHLATAATLVSGYPVLKSGLASLTRGKISHDLLISLTAYSALILKENIFGLATVWAVNLTSLLQALAVARSHQYIKAKSDLNKVLVQSATSHEMIPVSQTVPGEVFSFQRYSLIPFKAKVHSGTGIINETTNTGKTMHRLVKKNDLIEPGNLVEAGNLSLEVLETPVVASPVKICLGQGHLRQDNFINIFVKISFALSLLSFILTRDIQRSINMLLASVPASYSMSAPTALCSAVRYQTRRGTTILDPEQLLKAAHVDTFLFDKTGTLTTGQWEINHTITLDQDWTEETILHTASNIRHSAGYGERDPLAALINSVETTSPPLENIILHSSGIRCKSQDDSMLLGTPTYISTRGVSLRKYQSQIKSLQEKGTVVTVLVLNRVPVGIIGLEEVIRPESYLLMRKLKQIGITRLGIVSGDTQEACLNVAQKLGISQVWGNLDEQKKGQIVREFRHLGCHVCMVGDGINDRTALRDAQVSITLKDMHYLSPVAESGIILPENSLDRAADLISFGIEVNNCAKNNKFLTGSLDIVGLSLASANLLNPALSTLLANVSIFGVLLNSTQCNFSEKRVHKQSSLSLSRFHGWSLEKSFRPSDHDFIPTDKNYLSQSVKPWYAFSAHEVVNTFNSHTGNGLMDHQIAGSLNAVGPNQFYLHPKPSLLTRFFSQFKDFMIQLLLGASLVSFFLGERMDAVTILSIVCLEAFIGIIQERKAEQSLAALKGLAAPVARVIREGKRLLLPAQEIVPGDVIILEPGDRIPADARLIETHNLEVEEAALTGESLAVAKDGQRLLPEGTSVADRSNMVFMGTHATGGRGKGIVVNTGMYTEMGKIAAMLEKTEEESTPLQKYLDKLGKHITLGCLAACGLIVIIGSLRGRPLFEMLRTGISLAVGAIPEGLPVVVTIALAFGVKRMVKGNTIVRQLPAVENLGNINVICTDKTGTLTRNEMSVKQVYSSSRSWHVTESGYDRKGDFLVDGQSILPAGDAHLLKILTVGALCNNARLENGSILGDPTDCAALMAATKAGIWEKTTESFFRCKEAPFDATRKAMSVICQDREGNLGLYVKGAPEVIIEKCTTIIHNSQSKILTPDNKKEISQAGEKMADQALRVIATAYKPISKSEINRDPSILENDLIFAGLMGLEDPPKPGVSEAIAACHEAGIKVVMVTGDHVHTAQAIGQQIGLLKFNGITLTGNMLDQMSDHELASAIDEVVIFARTSPEHKLRIVKAFKCKGFIVAMTGDGVNDAPAVKEADIGIAMGRAGTDVTCESSDVVLTDDNFSTIVLAIKEGRGIKENIKTSIRYVLAGNFGEVLAMFLAVAGGQPLPLIPTQILWINLATESFPALALGGAPPGNSFIPANRGLMNHDQWKCLFLRGLLAGASTYGLFAFSLRTGASLIKARTLGFANIIINQMFHALDCNAASGQKKNPPGLLPTVLLSTALLLGVIYLPGMGSIFSTVPLSLRDWWIVLLSAGIIGRLDVLFKKLT